MLYTVVAASLSFFVNPPAFAPRVNARMEVAAPKAAGPLAENVWSMASKVRVEGNTLKTWDLGDESIERVQLAIGGTRRPIHANVELWTTPSYIPYKFRIYTEDGEVRPVTSIIETPKNPKTVAVYNDGQMEFPFDATVVDTGLESAYDSLKMQESELVQGAGAIRSYTFGGEVKSVQVLLKAPERNMKARIELLQGPNQIKQSIELYSSKYVNPAFFVIQTPGYDTTLRIINENTVEFPLEAWVLPYETDAAGAQDVVIGGGF